MKRLLETATTEIEIKKSRFISIAYPVESLEEVKEKVILTRSLHPNATHVVHSAVVGKSGTLFSSSDDREPKNTAGRPSLEVLKGSGITNICVCTVRYFGGTLLGPGGLVKAYGDSTKEVLKIVKTEELIERESFTAVMQYDHYTLAKRLLDETTATDITEDFGVGITIKGKIPLSMHDNLQKGFQNIGQGRIQLTFQS
ncbi:MAG: YigZ family protein [Spirochaetales bacterium]|nr:YigZ family protein [Spirochaetales bacterium]